MSHANIKLSIVLLSTGLEVGGAEQQVIYLARALLAKGHQVQVISMISLGKIGLQAQAEGLSVQSLDMKRGKVDFHAFRQLVRYLRREKPQILTSFMYHANLLGRVAGSLANIPVIISSIRNENFGGQSREWLIRLTNWMNDVCTTNSVLVADRLGERKVIAPGKLQVISNGIVLPEKSCTFQQRIRIKQELGVPEDAFLWLAIGRLVEQKDYPNLLNAMCQLDHPNVYLRVAGEGFLLSQLEDLAQNLGIQQQVSFLGVRQDIPDLLMAADGLVLSSAWEGMPNVVMEALAYRTPVVATDVGGVRELVEEGKSGFVVPPRDSIALSKAMDQLIRLSDQQRQQMGETGFSHIQSHYALEQVVHNWENLYQKLLMNKLS